MVWLRPDYVAVALARHFSFNLEKEIDKVLLILTYFLILIAAFLAQKPILEIVLSDQVLVLA